MSEKGTSLESAEENFRGGKKNWILEEKEIVSFVFDKTFKKERAERKKKGGEPWERRSGRCDCEKREYRARHVGRAVSGFADHINSS